MFDDFLKTIGRISKLITDLDRGEKIGLEHIVLENIRAVLNHYFHVLKGLRMG